MADDHLPHTKQGVVDHLDAHRYMKIVDTGETAPEDGKPLYAWAFVEVSGAGAAAAQGTFDSPTQWLSHEQLAVAGTAVGLPSVPVDAIGVVIQNIPVTGSHAARYTLDGATTPVGGGISGTGFFLPPGNTIRLSSNDTDLADFKVIRDPASGTAYLEISYYRLAP